MSPAATGDRSCRRSATASNSISTARGCRASARRAGSWLLAGRVSTALRSPWRSPSSQGQCDMHLLAAEPGIIADGSTAIDLAQTPGDIIVLASADTEIALLAAAQARRGPSARGLVPGGAEAPEGPSLRL